MNTKLGAVRQLRLENAVTHWEQGLDLSSRNMVIASWDRAWDSGLAGRRD